MRLFGFALILGSVLSSAVFAEESMVLPEKRLIYQQDTDLPGGDVLQMLDSSIEACVRACMANSACTAITFNSRNNSCFGKQNPDSGMPFLGAISARLEAVPADTQRQAVMRRDELLVFLRDDDISAARSQAELLPQKNPVDTLSAEELTMRIDDAAQRGDHSSATSDYAKLVALRDTAQDWLGYGRELAQLAQQDQDRANDLRRQSLQAALNGYLHSADDPQLRHDILRLMAMDLEDLGRGRDAMKALRLAQMLVNDPETKRLYEEASAKYGFRILDHEVQADNARPRICANFSEDLLKAGIDYADYLRLPAPDLAVTLSGDRQICVEGLTHGNRYSLTFRAGLPAQDGQWMAKDVEISSYIRDRSPVVRFPGRAYVLPRAVDAALPVVTSNTQSLDLTLFHVSDRSIVRAMQQNYLREPIEPWQEEGFTDQMGSQIWSGTATVGQEMNKDITTRLPMGEALAGQKPGIYVLKAALAGKSSYDATPAWQWFILSDIGITSFTATDGLHVVLRGLADTTAKEGAQVDLISAGNEVLATVTTDANGYARIDPALLKGVAAQAPALLVARQGAEDFAFISLTDPEFDLSDRGVEGREAAPPIDVFLTTERGAYRAGETVHAVALARDSKAEAVAGLPLTARLQRPDGVEYARYLVDDAGAGGHVFTMPLSGNAPRGVWRLDILADVTTAPLVSKTFLVEDFLPERIDFKLSGSADALAPDQPAQVALDARYLFGAPAADLAIEGEVVLRAAKDLPKYQGYVFGPHDQPFTALTESITPARSDDAGHADLSLTLPQAEDPQRPLEARIVLRMAEGSGRPVERELVLPIATTAPLIGIKPMFEDSAPQGSDAAFSLVALGTGQALPAKWELTRIETRYQWYQAHGNWNWEPITSRSPVSSGQIDLTDTAQQIDARVDWGQYELKVISDDGRALSSTTFYAGWYAPADVTTTPDMLELSLDKKDYRSGETAQLRLVPRAAGTAVVSILSNRLISMQVVAIKEGENLIDLPVTDDWGAGVYVTASALSPMDAKAGRMPARAMGLAHAAIDPGPRKLQASLEVPTEAKPRAPLDVALKVEGHDASSPVFATIAVVDEGILNLTRFTAPDPAGHYFGQRKLGVGIRDIYGRLIDPLNGVEGQIRSGGDAGAQARLQAPPPTEELLAYFSGPLTVGPDGYARAQFDLPAFNGSAKVMAVVWSDKAVGQASSDVLIRDPVVVTASLPRFMSPDDESRLLLEFHHATGPAGDMPLQVTASGLELGPLPATIALAENGQAKLEIPLRAQTVGLQELRVSLTTPDGQELVKTLLLPVQVNDPLVAKTTRMELASGQSLTLDDTIFAGLRPENASATIALGAFGRLDTAGLLAMLDAYPYGCTEQVTSKAMPLLYHQQVAEALGMSSAQDIRRRIDDSVTKVLANQTAEGAFGLWSPGNGDLWLDSYVTDFLTRAKAQGVAVPQVALRQALDNLRNQVNYTSDFSREDDTASAALAYALMVLARESAAAIGDLRYYADVKADDFASPLAQAQLGMALASYGDQPRADQMFRKAQDNLARQKADREQVFRADYGSRYRDAAGLLTLAAEAGSQAVNLEDLAKDLAVAPSRLSTQEAGWGLMASHALITGQAQSRVLANGLPFDGPPVRKISAGQAALELTNNGDATDVTLTTFGIPEGAQLADGNGYAINRSYYDMAGQAVDISEVSVGDRLVALLEVIPFNDTRARLMVADPLPAGFEIDNPNLLAAGDLAQLDWLELASNITHAEFRQDRFMAALDQQGTNKIRLAYIVRAVSTGRFHHPSASVEDMYRPAFRAQSASGSVAIAP